MNIASTPHYSQEELDSLIIRPKHVAIIPDGNRRWAKKNGLNPFSGHNAGCDIVLDIVDAAREMKIPTLTFYTFSTENWQRSPVEVEILMSLLTKYLKEQTPRMLEGGVRLCTIGDIKKFPTSLQEQLKETMDATANCSSIDLILALNYGGRNEIVRAVHQIIKETKNNALKEEEIDEECFARYLDTAPWGDPDLLIRTSGEQRISNFLLWQLSYTEIFTTEKLWPDFTSADFFSALVSFQKRQRRLGE